MYADNPPGSLRGNKMAARPVKMLVVLSLFTAGRLAHAGDTTVLPPDREDAALDEIVVVANKAERRLREVAANVTVLTRAQLADDLSMSLGDSFRYTPGIDEELASSRFGSWRVTSVRASRRLGAAIADMFTCVVALSMKLACTV